jgi:hypothetical protein
VVILPNGVDSLYDTSIHVGPREDHFCKWVQRVWTLPEVSLAKRSTVVFCLTEQKVVNFKEMKKYIKDELSDYLYNTKNKNTIMFTSLENYADFICHQTRICYDTRCIDDLGYTPEKLTYWIHKIAERNCLKDADRIYSILPMLNINNMKFVNSNANFEEAVTDVFCNINDKSVMARLILSTATCGCHFNSTGTSVFPNLKIKNNNESRKQLVNIESTIWPYDDLSMSFYRNKGLIINNARVIFDITIRRHIAEHINFDYLSSNTGYELGSCNIPQSVGKCIFLQSAKELNVNLIGICKTKISPAQLQLYKNIPDLEKYEFDIYHNDDFLNGFEKYMKNGELKITNDTIDFLEKQCNIHEELKKSENYRLKRFVEKIKINEKYNFIVKEYNTCSSFYLYSKDIDLICCIVCNIYMKKIGVLIIDSKVFYSLIPQTTNVTIC